MRGTFKTVTHGLPLHPSAMVRPAARILIAVLATLAMMWGSSTSPVVAHPATHLAASVPSAATTGLDWPGCASLKITRNGWPSTHTRVAGKCLGHKQVRLTIDQAQIPAGYATRATGRVFGHKVAVTGDVAWGDSDSPIQVHFSGLNVTGFDGHGTPWAQPISAIYGFGLSGSNYYCHATPPVSASAPIRITTAPFGASHVTDPVPTADGRGTVFAICATLIEATSPYILVSGD